MKIGFVRRGYSSSGGAERFLDRLATAAIDAGHEAVLFTSTPWPWEDWEGEQVVVKGRSPLEFSESVVEQYRGKCDILFSLERIAECDIYRAGDGVHASWMERRKAVEPKWKQWSRRIFNGKHREILSLEKALFSPTGAGAVIANSEMVKREIVAYYGYRADQIHVIYNGLSLKKQFSDAKAREVRQKIRSRLGFSEEEYVVLFVGSGWERKGLRFAVEAVRQLSKPATLLVVGRGSRRSIKASDRVRYAGVVVGEAPVKEYYAAADAFILPTIYDPFSNACLEALAAGLPVITTLANGFSEILDAGVNGEVLTDPTDISSVARAIEAWRDPARREAIRPQLKALAGRYTIEANLQATLEVIEPLLATNSLR